MLEKNISPYTAGIFEIIPPFIPDLLNDLGGAASDLVRNAQKEFLRGVANVGSETQIAFSDVYKTLSKAADDSIRNVKKSEEDIYAEVLRTGKHLEDTAKAVGRYLERQAVAQRDHTRHAFERIRAGQIIDGIWGREISLLRSTEENTGRLLLESDLLRAVAQIGIAAYLGPKGAAAFAAWLTYRETRDLDLAIRAGVIAGAATWANGKVAEVESHSAYETTKRAIVTGAIGGAAVAGAGGNEDAVRDAVLKGGLMIVIQDGFREFDGHALTGKGPTKEPYSVPRDGAKVGDRYPPPEAYIRDGDGNLIVVDGAPLMDTRMLDGEVSSVGVQAEFDPSLEIDSSNWYVENSAFMKAVAKIPGMQGMSIFHDQWAMYWRMGRFAKAATIPPAVVLTYWGLGAPIYEGILDVVRDSRRDDAEVLARYMGFIDTRIPPKRRARTTLRLDRENAIQSYVCKRNEVTLMIIVDASKKGEATVYRVIHYGKDSCRTIYRSTRLANALKRASNYARELVHSGFACVQSDVWGKSAAALN